MFKTFSKEDTKQENIKTKVKFTTMLTVETREQLETIAKNKGMSMGSVIDTMIR